MSEWKLSRLISNGMVLQQKKPIRIWGFDEPGRKVKVSFLGEEYVALTDGEGLWEVRMKAMEPGGPYTMDIQDNAGNEMAITDILVGDVWICAGQSNMELPMERVKDHYPKEGDTLSAKRDQVYDNAVIASEADFDSVWDSMLADYLNAGGQAIMDERAAKWEATFGDADELP